MTSTGSSKWHQLSNSPIIVVTTLVIALVGAVTGTISFFREQRVDLHLRAYYGVVGERAVQVGIVNNSSRGVSLVGGALVLDGSSDDPIAEVVRVQRGDPEPGDLRTEQELFAAADQLPFAIAGGQSFAGSVLFIPPTEANPDALRLYNLVFEEFDPDYRSRVWLRLDFAPGGSKTAQVDVPPGPNPRYRILNHAPGWRSTLVLDRRLHVETILIAGPGQALGTLKLWKIRNPRPVFEATLPIIERQGVHFHLPPLSSGEYDWAVR